MIQVAADAHGPIKVWVGPDMRLYRFYDSQPTFWSIAYRISVRTEADGSTSKLWDSAAASGALRLSSLSDESSTESRSSPDKCPRPQRRNSLRGLRTRQDKLDMASQDNMHRKRLLAPLHKQTKPKPSDEIQAGSSLYHFVVKAVGMTTTKC